MRYKLHLIDSRSLDNDKRSRKPLGPRSSRAEVSSAVRAVLEHGVSPLAASEVYGVHWTTLYRHLRGAGHAVPRRTTAYLRTLADRVAYEHRTVREVAEEAGVPASSLYRVVRRLLQSGTWAGADVLFERIGQGVLEGEEQRRP